ncbi:SDR family NAD(P)-dependent oxidoreductase [Bacillus licheniformis]|nr:SDR family NAD(P)-dependent oxidoreductase [Bacillus licheniformis]
MKKHSGAKIINLSSISGRIAFPAFSAYASSKHAVEGFSESLRLELRPFGINVAVVQPGSYQSAVAELDVTNEQSISSFSEELKQYGQIDVLINNAGTAYGGFAEELSLGDYRKQYDTNVFGLVAVTKDQQAKILNGGNSLNNKIAIVTGATSGFGLLTALKLASTHFVIATARHPEKAEALRNRIAELSIESSTVCFFLLLEPSYEKTASDIVQ